MKTGVTRPEWDTPPGGDFVRYVERLTAPPPPASAPAPAPPHGLPPAAVPQPGVASLAALLPAGGLGGLLLALLQRAAAAGARPTGPTPPLPLQQPRPAVRQRSNSQGKKTPP